MKQVDNKSKTEALHELAEEMLKKKPSESISEKDMADTLGLIHELEVHQIELEIQNEELKMAREAEKVAAEKYGTLYDLAPTGLFTLSKKSEIIDLNLEGAKLLGKEPTWLKNKRLSYFVSHDSKSTFKDFIARLFKNDMKETCELVISKDWKLPVKVYVTGIADRNKEQCLVAVIDITERKQIESLIKDKEYAEESDRLKSVFLANMSHEIRTPMNAIIGFSEILSNPDTTEIKRQQYSTIIKERAYDLLHLIDDILDVSRLEVGQMKIYKTEFKLNDLMINLFEEYYQKIKNSLDKSDIQLKLSVADELKKLWIKTDKYRLKQILTNLVDNALKFTQKGSIELGCIAESRAKIVFFVKDTGAGIPADKQNIIFDRFRQADESISSRLYGGAGLGLSIVKGIINLLDGRIWFESRLKRGSGFYFTISLDEPADKESGIIESASLPNTVLNDLTLLVVEDNESSAAYLKELLADTGIISLYARNGEQALQIFQKNPSVKMVLMDICLPDINGLELTRMMKERNPELIVIAQTAYATYSDSVECIQAGCTDYLSKPINPAKLLSLLRQSSPSHTQLRNK